MTRPRSKQSWVRNFSRKLTRGKLTLGNSRREPRSRRVQMEAIAAAPTLHKPADKPLPKSFGLFGIILVLVVAVGGIVYALFGTDWFYIYDVEVAGTTYMSKAEIYTRANVEGLHLFWLNPTDVTARLMEEPLVRNASVSVFPPNRVTVTIQEREPVAVWQTKGHSYFVDKTGTLFAVRGDATEMLVIRNLADTAVVPGDTIDPTIVEAAVDLNQLIPDRRAFDWEPGLGIGYLSDAKYWVHFGDYTRLNAKVAAYRAFMEQIKPEQEIVLLDLSVPEHPYYKVAPGSAAVEAEAAP